MSEQRDYAFRLPDIGEGIAEAEIVAWHVAVGDRVEEDAPLADVMTDKATVEMTAPVDGVIVSLGGAVGDMVAIGSVLAVFQTDAQAGSAPDPAPTPDPDEPPVAVEAVPATAAPGKDDGKLAESDPPVPHAGGDAVPERRILASPAVRQRARTLNIDLADVKVAPGDRIRHADLDAFLSYNRSMGYVAGGEVRADEQIKVIGLRRRIAENMAASKRNIPHFTYVESFDVTKIVAMAADLNANRGSRPKLTLLPFLIVALCRTLPEFPMLNARYDDEAGIVTRHGAVHMGIATQTDAGLMVPVIRDAQDRNLWQLAEEIARLAQAARTGKSSVADLGNSTFTITSLGPLGGISTTPVINRPEVAIIGPNKIVDTVVPRDGEFVVAKLMNISISCDHRVVDGWDAASFIQALKARIETPAILFAV